MTRLPSPQIKHILGTITPFNILVQVKCCLTRCRQANTISLTQLDLYTSLCWWPNWMGILKSTTSIGVDKICFWLVTTVISQINYLHNIHGQKRNFLLRTNLLHLIYICEIYICLPGIYRFWSIIDQWGGVSIHFKFLQPLNLFDWNNKYLSWTSKNKLVQSSPNYSFDNSQLHAKIQYPRTTLYSGKVTTTED